MHQKLRNNLKFPLKLSWIYSSLGPASLQMSQLQDNSSTQVEWSGRVHDKRLCPWLAMNFQAVSNSWKTKENLFS